MFVECEHFAKALHMREAIVPDEDGAPFGLEPKHGALRDLLRVLFIGGHLMPTFLLSAEPGRYTTHRPLQWKNCFGHRKILIQHKELHVTWQRFMDRSMGVRLALRGAKCAVQLLIQWKHVAEDWRKKAEYMCSFSAWIKRFVRKKTAQK
jgi:hypothetical protein